MTEALSGDASAAMLLDNVSLELTYTTEDSGKTSYELSVMMGSSPLISLAISSEVTTGGEISVPSNALDATDTEMLAQWLEGMNIDGVLTALENANVPAELVEVVRSYVAMLQYGMA